MRVRQLPVRFRDPLPTSAPPIPRTLAGGNELERQPSPERSGCNIEGIEGPIGPESHSPTITSTNSFGVFREYLSVSSHNPHNPDVFADAHPPLSPPQPVGSSLMVAAPPELGDGPMANSNVSKDLLLAWSTRGLGSTPAGLDDLVNNVIKHPAFLPSELEDFNAVTAIRQFKREWFSKPGTALKAGDGWKEGSVSIRVPCTGVGQLESEAPEFVVSGILYRDVVEVITAELEDPETFDDIHVTPYKEWWIPGSGEEPIRVYSEIYNSDAMLEVDTEMRDNLGATPHGPDDDLEAFIVSALLYSDSTHLASFGSASLWPIYLFLGNVSKYTRSKPTSFSAHHIAYIPTVRLSPFKINSQPQLI